MPLPIPAAVVDAPTSADWEAFERRYCLVPPSYKAFIGSHGSGCVDGFIYFFNPAARNPHLNLLARNGRYAVNPTWVVDPARLPADAGLAGRQFYPFGSTDNGDTFCWAFTAGASAPATLIVDAKSTRCELYDRDCMALVEALLSRQVTSGVFPATFPSERPSFEASK